MATQVDFLRKPTDSRLRKEIQNICDSYSNPWDILAELLQNAMDAIRVHKQEFGENSKKHKIDIEIDSTNRSIRVRDTGIGFPIASIHELLAPHGSGKSVSDTRHRAERRWPYLRDVYFR